MTTDISPSIDKVEYAGKRTATIYHRNFKTQVILDPLATTNEVQVGKYVDVLAIIPMQTPDGKVDVSEPILQGIEVLYLPRDFRQREVEELTKKPFSITLNCSYLQQELFRRASEAGQVAIRVSSK